MWDSNCAPEMLEMKAMAASPEPYVLERIGAGAGAPLGDGRAIEGPGAMAAQLPCRQNAPSNRKATILSLMACIEAP